MTTIFDKNRVRLTKNDQIIHYVTCLVNRVNPQYKEIQHNRIVFDKIKNWLNGEKDVLELSTDESRIFELFSADAYESFSNSISFFKLLFVPKRMKFDPNDIAFTNAYGSSYLDVFNGLNIDDEPKDNVLRIIFSNKSYLLIIKGNFLNISNENDASDLCKKTLFVPFIEKIWIFKYKINFSTISKLLKIRYHGKEEILFELKEPFNSMPDEYIDAIIKFLLNHNQLIKVGY